MSTMTPRGTMGMEDNIQKIIGDTITELFDMLGKGEARRKQTIDCLLFLFWDIGQVAMQRIRSIVSWGLSCVVTSYNL